MSESEEVAELRRLKPCPFCMSAEVDPRGWTTENAEVAGPACDGCGATACGEDEWESRSDPRPLAPPEPCGGEQPERPFYEPQLKPCPFCGSQLVDPQGWLGADGSRGPECDGCGATAETAAGWNARMERGQASGRAAFRIVERRGEDLFGVYTVQREDESEEQARARAWRHSGELPPVDPTNPLLTEVF